MRRLNPEEDAVWKPPQQSASSVTVHYGKPVRMRSYHGHHIVDSVQKLFSETGSLTFIPAICSLDLSGGYRASDDWQTGLITCAHGFV